MEPHSGTHTLCTVWHTHLVHCVAHTPCARYAAQGYKWDGTEESRNRSSVRFGKFSNFLSKSFRLKRYHIVWEPTL
jgi:hypothetical protein